MDEQAFWLTRESDGVVVCLPLSELRGWIWEWKTRSDWPAGWTITTRNPNA